MKRCSETKTFEDVIDLARELFEYCEEKQEEKEDMMLPQPSAEGDGDQEADRQEEINPTSDTDEEKEWFTESDPEQDHRERSK